MRQINSTLEVNAKLLDGHTVEEFKQISLLCENEFDWTDDPFAAEEEVPEAFTDDEVVNDEEAA